MSASSAAIRASLACWSAPDFPERPSSSWVFCCNWPVHRPNSFSRPSIRSCWIRFWAFRSLTFCESAHSETKTTATQHKTKIKLLLLIMMISFSTGQSFLFVSSTTIFACYALPSVNTLICVFSLRVWASFLSFLFSPFWSLCRLHRR